MAGADGIDWELATAECVEHLRALIRIPSVNPAGIADGAAGRDSIGAETAAASYCAEALTAAGIASEVLESAPGRGSCFARLPATVPNPEPPIVLLSHVDVVPVDAEMWSRDPFAADLVDGVVWGRGAVDMKDMVAMELSVMLALARSAAERRRDVIFATVADEEAGGAFGAMRWVSARPDLFADARGRHAAVALNEVGGYSMTIGGQRVYSIQVAEKGIAWTRMRSTGTTGHGSMPHDDNAAIKLAEAVTRLAAAPRPVRLTPVVGAFLAAVGLGGVADRIRAGDEPGAFAALDAAVEDPVLRRSVSAMLRDTVTTNMIHAGKKMNVIPGSGEAEIDVRTLPGTNQVTLLAEMQAVVGALARVEPVMLMPATEWPSDAPIVELMREALLRADPDALVAPMMITPGTDAKALALLGIPTYGFAPLRLDAGVPFLSLFHGHDERVPVSALRFGLPVLHEVVSRFVEAAGAADRPREGPRLYSRPSQRPQMRMTDQTDTTDAAPEPRAHAFVFPGQGSQYVGMGTALLERSPAAAAVMERADAALGFPLSRLIAEGPAEELDLTVNAQPAILATSVAYLEAMRAEAREAGVELAPLRVAGHSAGQYAAAVAADAIDFETAIGLVRERGRIMQERGIEGGMGAVIGLTDEQVHEVVDAAREHGEIGVANANAPGQIVLSGVIPALAFALEMSKTVGARKAVRLTVSVASHSPLMRRARDEFSQILAKVPFREPRVPMLGNVHATVIRTADGLRRELSEHLVHGVQWTETIRRMAADGVTDFVEIGPGRVLSGLIKRIAPEAATHALDAPGNGALWLPGSLEATA